MTTPMIETVRTIPLIVDSVPMEADTCDSGFPFEREDRDDHFRSQLDDIAKRHPEFAEHLEGFPFRSDSLGRRRPPRPSESEFRRYTDRPFGSSRFERFGFPFTRDSFEDEFQEPKQQQQQEEYPKQQQQHQEQEIPRPERGRKQNIQQSNTVDLGQKQEPVNDRNQRSMSAPPPDNRPRYVSSINIPINRDGGMGDMGKVQSQPQQQPQHQHQQQSDKPVERVIPIHVEGRDEPVLPKHTGPSFSQPQPEKAFGQQPQPERIFGHRPSQFTQFVPPRQFSGPEVKQQQKFQQQAPPPQQPKFQQQQQEPKPQEQVPPQPQPQPQQQEQQPLKPNPIDIIQLIQKDVSELMSQVEKFSGVPRDKQYLYLDEMLTRNLIKLDNIDTQGQENIRLARKEAIKCIERCIGILEAKAAANVPQENKPEGSQQQTEETIKEEEMKEVESKSEEPAQPITDPKVEESQAAVQEKMEVEGETPVNEERRAVFVPPVGDKIENVKEETKIEVQPPGEEKMEVAPEPIEEKNAPSETKPLDEEMKEVPSAEESKTVALPPSEESKKEGEEVNNPNQEENKDDTSSEDKKDKKKGKKKVVKK